jgi:uncharacterized protein
MIFNVSGLVQDGIGATRRHKIDETLTNPAGKPEKVRGDVELLRTKAGVLVRAWLELATAAECSRCLRPLEATIPVRFEEEFLATLDLRSGQPLDEEPDADAFKIDENHLLDLTEAIRQYREVSREMQPLCRPDCRGLCPRCGADLNEGDCGCEAGAIDARWAGLAGLLEDKLETEKPAPDGRPAKESAGGRRVRSEGSASSNRRNSRRTA